LSVWGFGFGVWGFGFRVLAVRVEALGLDENAVPPHSVLEEFRVGVLNSIHRP